MIVLMTSSFVPGTITIIANGYADPEQLGEAF